MVESIAIVLAAAGIGLSAGLAIAVARLYKKSEQMQQALSSLQKTANSRIEQTPATDPDTYLSGFRIALSIAQDHTIPTLSLLLKEALVACDAEVTMIGTEQAQSFVKNWGTNTHSASDQPDVLVWGNITCNGYSESYYSAHLNYLTPYGMLNPTSERPAQGNPQNSLVADIVSKIKKGTISAQTRAERVRAIGELRQEGLLRQIGK